MKTILMLLLFCCGAINAWGSEGYFYGQVDAGAGLLNDAENSSRSGTFNVESSAGYVAAASLGYAFPDSSRYHGGRVSIEAAYRQNDIDKIEFSEGEFSGGGETSAWSLLLNSYGEQRSAGPWTPYVGLGLGVASVALDAVTVAGAPLADDDDLVFAYQISLGADYELSSRLHLDLGYRYFGTLKPTFKDNSGENFDSEYGQHSFLLGLRMGF